MLPSTRMENSAESPRRSGRLPSWCRHRRAIPYRLGTKDVVTLGPYISFSIDVAPDETGDRHPLTPAQRARIRHLLMIAVLDLGLLLIVLPALTVVAIITGLH